MLKGLFENIRDLEKQSRDNGTNTDSLQRYTVCF
jgi:hypothetical protein